MTSQSDLLKAYNDTTRPQLDMGVDADVLADMGYQSFEDTARLMSEIESRTRKVAEGVGAITCGDCGRIIPCPHAGVTRGGKGYTIGN